VASADLFCEKNIVVWLVAGADLFGEKSIAG
jgi:hypothetical protein